MPAPTNDFLPVAVGGIPNVQSQAGYVASTDRLQGWPDGAIPPATVWNKMLRQASSMAAILAQVMCNITGQNMPDDGDMATKIALLQGMFPRIALTANTTFYVAITGNDSTGDGSSGNPWRTGQKAWNTLAKSYDLAGFTVTIFRQDSLLYTDETICSGFLTGQVGAVHFSANGIANCYINSGITDCYRSDAGAFISIENQKMANGAGSALYCSRGSGLIYLNVEFGACGGNHVTVDRNGNSQQTGAITISGGASAHLGISTGGTSDVSSATIVGTVNFSQAFIDCEQVANVTSPGGQTWLGGTVTGKRYNATLNAVINTQGSGPTYFPGSIGGTTATGGQYN